ncbi:MAG: hypothetical protein JXA74_06735 [Anaerolineae bacterium]|nr:hypothetical protein [Anaerolineae bacterium]
MYAYHRRTIENLSSALQGDARHLALIPVESVARGDAGRDSAVDYCLVLSGQTLTPLLETGNLAQPLEW